MVGLRPQNSGKERILGYLFLFIKFGLAKTTSEGVKKSPSVLRSPCSKIPWGAPCPQFGDKKTSDDPSRMSITCDLTAWGISSPE